MTPNVVNSNTEPQFTTCKFQGLSFTLFFYPVNNMIPINHYGILTAPILNTLPNSTRSLTYIAGNLLFLIYLVFKIYPVKDMLVKCNRPKRNPSSLGFNLLYIHILWFIVIHNLYYTNILLTCIHLGFPP